MMRCHARIRAFIIVALAILMIIGGNPALAQKTFDQFTRLSAPVLGANSRPDLLIWPESSMPGPVMQDEVSHRFVMDFSASARTARAGAWRAGLWAAPARWT